MYTLYIFNESGLSIQWLKTEKECLNFVQKNAPFIHKYKYIPTDKQISQSFFPALYWNFSKDDIDINIDIAKTIKLDQLRLIRDSLFPKLDQLFMRAIEEQNSEKRKKIVDLKQKLRDVTKNELPSDLQYLQYYYPSVFTEIEIL
jgi:hypothetical protein